MLSLAKNALKSFFSLSRVLLGGSWQIAKAGVLSALVGAAWTYALGMEFLLFDLLFHFGHPKNMVGAITQLGLGIVALSAIPLSINAYKGRFTLKNLGQYAQEFAKFMGAHYALYGSLQAGLGARQGEIRVALITGGISFAVEGLKLGAEWAKKGLAWFEDAKKQMAPPLPIDPDLLRRLQSFDQRVCAAQREEEKRIAQAQAALAQVQPVQETPSQPSVITNAHLRELAMAREERAKKAAEERQLSASVEEDNGVGVGRPGNPRP